MGKGTEGNATVCHVTPHQNDLGVVLNPRKKRARQRLWQQTSPEHAPCFALRWTTTVVLHFRHSIDFAEKLTNHPRAMQGCFAFVVYQQRFVVLGTKHNRVHLG